jgi:hypothetical protein
VNDPSVTKQAIVLERKALMSTNPRAACPQIDSTCEQRYHGDHGEKPSEYGESL